MTSALPQYYLLAGKAEVPLTLGAHEDGYVVLRTDRKYSELPEGDQVLDQDACTFQLSGVADETSSVGLRAPFRVVSRLHREKVIVDHSNPSHAEFEAFPRVTSLDEEGDAFDLFTVHEPTPHGNMQFRMKFAHEPDEENDQMSLKFHSFKLLVPESAFETALEDENATGLLVMIKGHEVVAHSADAIAAEIGDGEDEAEEEEEPVEGEDPDQKLIGASSIKRRFSKAKSSVKNKASSAKRSVKSKFSSAKNSASRKFNSAKTGARNKFSNFRRGASNKFTNVRNKFTKRPNTPGGAAGGRTPPPIPPKPNTGNGKFTPPNKPLPPVPRKAPNKPLPPIPQKKPAAASPKQPRPPAGKPPGKQPGRKPSPNRKPKPNNNKGGGGGTKGGGGNGGGGGGGGGQQGRQELEEEEAFGAGLAGGAVAGTALGPGVYGYPVQAYPVGGVVPQQGYPQYAGGVPVQQPGMYPQQQVQPQYQPGYGQQTYQPPMNSTTPGQAQGAYSQNGGQQQQQQPTQYTEARFQPNFVPEDAPIADSITFEDVVSRRKRIVNKVAAAYEAKLGRRPSQEALDSLHARLDEKILLTTNAVLEVVIDWLVDQIGGQMA